MASGTMVVHSRTGRRGWVVVAMDGAREVMFRGVRLVPVRWSGARVAVMVPVDQLQVIA